MKPRVTQTDTELFYNVGKYHNQYPIRRKKKQKMVIKEKKCQREKKWKSLCKCRSHVKKRKKFRFEAMRLL